MQPCNNVSDRSVVRYYSTGGGAKIVSVSSEQNGSVNKNAIRFGQNC